MDDRTCRHPACACEAASEQDPYCSAHCAERGESEASDHCDCGHADCD